MRFWILKILAKQVWQDTIKSRSTIVLIVLFNTLLLFSVFTGYFTMENHHENTEHYHTKVREGWEKSPDKHPHRMAHYGYVAFRENYPLSFFDFGMDSYLGNAVFLEAHRQNTVNFSEASFTSGLLRFGELSCALILQLLIPLLLIFWGFDLIAKERENGTLKILLTQAISWQELIWGKTLGLFILSLTVLLPILVVSSTLLVMSLDKHIGFEPIVRWALLVFSYLIFIGIVCLLTIFISAKSQSSKAALTQLIGFWLVFTLVLPKISQVVGQNIYHSPSKIEFDTAIEAELIKLGDSHNPNDPHFSALKDSLLKAYGVDSTHKLPFNYGGVVMQEGERLSAEVFNRHQKQLVQSYEQQQDIVRKTAIINPFMAIKNISMGLSGTDYANYQDFQKQTEAYRYQLAQHMNQLQIKLISNQKRKPTEKNYSISQKYWASFPDFEYRFLSLETVLKSEVYSFLAMAIWLFGLFFLIKNQERKFKA
ncbi:MAG: ABC transporter permease [Flectobacillus sp.]|uniref:ABC transporter permease n=1 Tax=Flectobacillus sp. TaxID=50419 RepID=UPI003B9A85D8